MHRTIVAFAALIASVNLLGCSQGPNDKVAAQLAQGYLSGMVPGISEKEISILKSSEKDGTTVFVVQAGGMVCDMPVIKGKDGWMTSGVSCKGQFEPQEKAEERKRSFMLASMKQAVEELNKKGPTMSADGKIRTDKHELVNTTMVVYQTDVTVNASDVTAKEIEDKRAEYASKACVKLRDLVTTGISYEYDVNDKNGNPLVKHLISKETCSKYL